MPFDPSVISDIGASGPDISGSMAKGFQLKDMVDTQQLNQLKLKQEKATLAEDEKFKTLSKSANLSNKQGVSEFAEKLTKAGQPDRAMEMMKYAHQQESGELDNILKKIEVHAGAQDVITGGIDKIWQQATAMKNAKTPDGRPKYTDASINAFIQGQIPAELSSIQSDNGLPQEVKGMALQNINKYLSSGQPVTYDTLTQIERSSKQGQAQIKSIREDLVAQTGQKREAETERHNQAMEGQGQQRVNLTKDRIARTTTGGLTGGSLDMLSDQAMAGDTSALVGLSKQDKEAVRNAMADKAQIQGLTGADQAARNANFVGIKAGERTLGTRQANIDSAVTEAQKVEPILRSASDALPRGKVTTLNEIIQMAERGTSDPRLLRFAQAARSFANIYTRAVVPGASGVADREESIKNLPTFTDQASFNGVLDIMNQEMQAAKESPASVREDMSRAITGRKPTEGAEVPKGTAPSIGKGDEDKQALDWANANPNDPRAAQIKKKLGAK